MHHMRALRFLVWTAHLLSALRNAPHALVSAGRPGAAASLRGGSISNLPYTMNADASSESHRQQHYRISSNDAAAQRQLLQDDGETVLASDGTVRVQQQIVQTTTRTDEDTLILEDLLLALQGDDVAEPFAGWDAETPSYYSPVCAEFASDTLICIPWFSMDWWKEILDFNQILRPRTFMT